MTEGIFDASVAPRYDAIHASSFDPSVLGPTINRLVELPDGGPALQFASGTGRVCVPLSQRGVEVQGIELSRPMVEQMLAKPGARGCRWRSATWPPPGSTVTSGWCTWCTTPSGTC